MKILKVGALIVIAAVVLVLVAALHKPDTLVVSRSIAVKAPPEKIAGFVDDFHNWGTWSPWEKKDPNMRRTFGGAAAGKGAVYEWDGSGDVGKGRIEITDVTPARITMDLHFIKPFEGRDVATFAFEPQGDATRVTWTMSGPAILLTKVMEVFLDMDKMIGSDFETGLANLKAAAER